MPPLESRFYILEISTCLVMVTGAALVAVDSIEGTFS